MHTTSIRNAAYSSLGRYLLDNGGPAVDAKKGSAVVSDPVDVVLVSVSKWPVVVVERTLPETLLLIVSKPPISVVVPLTSTEIVVLAGDTAVVGRYVGSSVEFIVPFRVANVMLALSTVKLVPVAGVVAFICQPEDVLPGTLSVELKEPIVVTPSVMFPDAVAFAVVRPTPDVCEFVVAVADPAVTSSASVTVWLFVVAIEVSLKTDSVVVGDGGASVFLVEVTAAVTLISLALISVVAVVSVSPVDSGAASVCVAVVSTVDTSPRFVVVAGSVETDTCRPAVV